MQMALTDLYQAKWSRMIHDEWMRNLLRNRPDLTRERLERTCERMDAHTRDCLVIGFEDLIDALELPDPGDRHVLAAAIHGRAHVIVTYNLRHFPSEHLSRYGIEAQHPDEFLTHLIDLAPGPVCATARTHRRRLKKPPKTVTEYLETLELSPFHNSWRICAHSKSCCDPLREPSTVGVPKLPFVPAPVYA
jgi:hypothetical protein